MQEISSSRLAHLSQGSLKDLSQNPRTFTRSCKTAGLHGDSCKPANQCRFSSSRKCPRGNLHAAKYLIPRPRRGNREATRPRLARCPSCSSLESRELRCRHFGGRHVVVVVENASVPATLVRLVSFWLGIFSWVSRKVARKKQKTPVSRNQGVEYHSGTGCPVGSREVDPKCGCFIYVDVAPTSGWL